MNLNAAALKLMAAKGLTLEDVAEIVAANEARTDSTAAERQRRCRENKRANGHTVTVTRDTPSPLNPPPKKTPDPKNNPPLISPQPEDLSAEPTPAPLTKREVVEAWQTRMVPQGFPPIRKMTSQRERQLNARLKDSTLEEWMQAMAALERSQFCRGENERGWRADFDFLLQPKSFTKLLEGAYDH